jgi:hypothetical protein
MRGIAYLKGEKGRNRTRPWPAKESFPVSLLFRPSFLWYFVIYASFRRRLKDQEGVYCVEVRNGHIKCLFRPHSLLSPIPVLASESTVSFYVMKMPHGVMAARMTRVAGRSPSLPRLSSIKSRFLLPSHCHFWRLSFHLIVHCSAILQC